MSKELKTITVLDYESGKVIQYDLDKFGDNYIFIDKDSPSNDELEDILIDQGHSLSNIQWMLHEDSTIYLK